MDAIVFRLLLIFQLQPWQILATTKCSMDAQVFKQFLSFLLQHWQVLDTTACSMDVRTSILSTRRSQWKVYIQHLLAAIQRRQSTMFLTKSFFKLQNKCCIKQDAAFLRLKPNIVFYNFNSR